MVPSLPELPPIRQYLPDLPSVPQIPLPDPLMMLKEQVSSLDSVFVSPIIQRINYLILTLSAIALFEPDFMVFKPQNLIRLAAGDSTENQQMPYIWTLVTSIFVETNLVYLIAHLFLMNYIVYKNRSSFESSWSAQDFFVMLCVSSLFATSTHFLIRLALFTFSADSYTSFSYSSTNFVILALLLGLR